MRKYLIPSAFVVWSLGRCRNVHHCETCGAKMFVRFASGLCPRCWNADRSPAEPTRANGDEEIYLLESMAIENLPK